jgi:hypothetical protein
MVRATIAKNTPRARRARPQARLADRVDRDLPDNTQARSDFKFMHLGRHSTKASKRQNAVLDRVPRLHDRDTGTTEAAPYQLWNQFVAMEKRNGIAAIDSNEFQRFTAVHRDKHNNEKVHYIRPKVTYKTTYKVKPGGCKYGSYKEGGHVYCLSNPNHHALDNPDPIKHDNALARPHETEEVPKKRGKSAPLVGERGFNPNLTTSSGTSAPTKKKRMTQVEKLKAWTMKK